MAQVTIYLDEDTEKSVRAAAEESGTSLSKWIADRIRKAAGAEWPAAVKELAGAWQDLPTAETLRRLQPKDSKRNRL